MTIYYNVCLILAKPVFHIIVAAIGAKVFFSMNNIMLVLDATVQEKLTFSANSVVMGHMLHSFF